MKKMASVLFTIFFATVSCKRGGNSINQIALEYELISETINATLKLDPGTSTNDYLIDFRAVKELSGEGIALYLAKNKHAEKTNADSLFKSDKIWKIHQYFHKTLIVIKKIDHLSDGTIVVITSKMIAYDGANGAEIVLRRTGNSYRCLRSNITWIS